MGCIPWGGRKGGVAGPGTYRKLFFPISFQLKGTRLPQENWYCLRLTVIIRLGLYIYRLPIFYFISHGAKMNQSVNLW